jgi:hypothetical protein
VSALPRYVDELTVPTRLASSAGAARTAERRSTTADAVRVRSLESCA